MVAPVVLVILSLVALASSVGLNGPELTLWSGSAALTLVASLILTVQAAVRALAKPHLPPEPTRPRIVVDGSNVMHWEGDVARIETLSAVLATLRGRGYDPGVIFDANVGYKISYRYLDDAELARRLKLSENRVLVVPRGTPADKTILQAARDLGVPVVTNDRYRDWEKEFPEVRLKGRLMNGTFKEGKVWLRELPAPVQNRSPDP